MTRVCSMSVFQRWSLGRLSLNARVGVVVVMMAVGLAGLTVLNAFSSRDRQMTALAHNLQSQIESAVSVAQRLHDRAQKGELSEAEAQRQALAQIHDMQWKGGKGYIFAFDSGLVMREHPLKPELVGKSIADETDFKGKPHYRIKIGRASCRERV